MRRSKFSEAQLAFILHWNVEYPKAHEGRRREAQTLLDNWPIQTGLPTQ